MRDIIRRFLTKRRETPEAKTRKVRVKEELPSENLVILVQFAIVVVAVLGVVETVHIVVLGSWNSEVFSGITGLIGTVTGIIIGKKT